MKKLQSLESFRSLGLNLKAMSHLTGGQASTETKAGCRSVNTEISATEYVTYTSDTTAGDYYNIKDVQNCD